MLNSGRSLELLVLTVTEARPPAPRLRPPTGRPGSARVSMYVYALVTQLCLTLRPRGL